MWDPYAEFEKAVLPNGLTVYASHWPGRSWERVAFVIHSGGAQDPIGLEGTAHFVEHMVSENTLMSRAEIVDFFEGSGGSVMLGSTGILSTEYGFFVPQNDREVIRRGFDLFGHMLFAAQLTNNIERERDVIVGEFHRRFATEIEYAEAARQHQMLYGPTHWLGRIVRVLGNPETISRISGTHLQTFYDLHYSPPNMSVVCLGGIPTNDMVRLIAESSFGRGKAGVRNPVVPPARVVSSPIETNRTFVISEHMRMAVPMKTMKYLTAAKLPGSVGEGAVDIMEDMLGQILFAEMREKRAWTYHTNITKTRFQELYQLVLESRGVALHARGEIMDVVNHCIRSLSERLDLFEKVKRSLLLGLRLYDINGRSVVNIARDDLAELHRIATLTEYMYGVANTQFSEIQEIAEHLRPEMRWTCLQVP